MNRFESEHVAGEADGLKVVLKILAYNLAGWVLVVTGLMLSLPGVPGPGTPIVLAGLALADWPGKMRFFRWLQSFKWFGRVDAWLRGRFGITLPGHGLGQAPPARDLQLTGPPTENPSASPGQSRTTQMASAPESESARASKPTRDETL